jgi:hypothetical protein
MTPGIQVTQKFQFYITVWSGSQISYYHLVWGRISYYNTIPGGSRRKFGFYIGHFPLFD